MSSLKFFGSLSIFSNTKLTFEYHLWSCYTFVKSSLLKCPNQSHQRKRRKSIFSTLFPQTPSLNERKLSGPVTGSHAYGKAPTHFRFAFDKKGALSLLKESEISLVLYLAEWKLES